MNMHHDIARIEIATRVRHAERRHAAVRALERHSAAARRWPRFRSA